MKKKYYLGIDQGTTGVAAILFDQQWNQIGRGYCEETLFYPKNGWVEHDPFNVLDAVLNAVKQVLRESLITPDEIICMGFDHEGETVVVWDKYTGKPVYNAIVWQDRRTTHLCEKLQEKYGKIIKDKTGLPVDSYFSATKLKWIIENIPGVQSKIQEHRLLAGNLDAWILWNITGRSVHMTDVSTASRTMLYNVSEKKWDTDILNLLEIPEEILPQIQDSNHLFGKTEPLMFFGIDVPISGVMTDQQAALLGQACVTPGRVKTTYGTGCFMLMNTGDTFVSSANGLLPTVAWSDNGKVSYALDGGIYIAGAATQWLRDNLSIIKSADETADMARKSKNKCELLFVPAFSGLAAPYWDSYARGMMIGITGNTSKEDIVKATLEATAYQVRDVLDVMEKDAGTSITIMRCDGGASKNDYLMQFQSDLLGIPVDVPVITETTSLGAAFMAASGIGALDLSRDIGRTWKLKRRYEPQMSEDEQLYRMNQWHRAVKRAKNWIVD